MNNNIGIACKITTGKLDANQAIQNGQYPFYTCAEFPDTIDSFAFDDDVVLVAGNNAKGNFHVNRFKGKFNAYQRTYVLTAKKGFDIDFIYYSLKLELKRLKEKSQGSQTKFLTMPILQNIGLKNLSESEQKQISSVLSTLDEKIALNNQINATLEQMAKTLYDYWFVQFDFPDDNGKPYKSSGGEMVYNEILKREIPKGWEVKKLVEIEKNIVTGKTPPTSNPEFFGDEIPFITISDIRNNTVIVENEQFLSRKGADYQKGKYLPSGSLCVSCIATVGLIGFTTRKSQTNQQINSIIFKHGFNRVFLFFALNNYFSVAKAKTGNTFANMNKADFEEINVVYPPIDVLKSFQDKVSNQFNLIKNQSKQNGELTKLRDWLLPMLMNGQVTVQ